MKNWIFLFTFLLLLIRSTNSQTTENGVIIQKSANSTMYENGFNLIRYLRSCFKEGMDVPKLKKKHLIYSMELEKPIMHTDWSLFFFTDFSTDFDIHSTTSATLFSNATGKIMNFTLFSNFTFEVFRIPLYIGNATVDVEVGNVSFHQTFSNNVITSVINMELKVTQIVLKGFYIGEAMIKQIITEIIENQYSDYFLRKVHENIDYFNLLLKVPFWVINMNRASEFPDLSNNITIYWMHLNNTFQNIYFNLDLPMLEFSYNTQYTWLDCEQISELHNVTDYDENYYPIQLSKEKFHGTFLLNYKLEVFFQSLVFVNTLQQQLHYYMTSSNCTIDEIAQYIPELADDFPGSSIISPNCYPTFKNTSAFSYKKDDIFVWKFTHNCTYNSTESPNILNAEYDMEIPFQFNVSFLDYDDTFNLRLISDELSITDVLTNVPISDSISKMNFIYFMESEFKEYYSKHPFIYIFHLWKIPFYFIGSNFRIEDEAKMVIDYCNGCYTPY